MGIRELFHKYHKSPSSMGQPYVIAEAGVNHEGNMDIAKRLVDEAQEAGADAIKFQTYRAERIASRQSPSYWDLSKEPTQSQYELFKKYDKFWKDEFEQLKRYCDDKEIEFLSTPFDLESAYFLNDLMDAFKISSSDITNKPFIQYIARFGKPVVLSTGASYLYEVQEAVDWLDEAGVPVALLHCILNYPTADEDANLGMITDLRRRFPDRIIGYSDHTLPREMDVLATAVLLGATIIEKHFTHDKKLPGNDHYHAMDKYDLLLLKDRMARIGLLCGSFRKHPLKSENGARANARRSLVSQRLIRKGEKIGEGDLTWKRPASGISPRYIDDVAGSTALCDILEDEPLRWHMIS